MHEKDRALIETIKKFFGNTGYVSKPNNASTVEFRVSTIRDIVDVILPHCDNYPLVTKKHWDYILFKQIVLFMLNGEHNTLEGTQKIVNIKAFLNLGLSDDLKKAFPNTTPLENQIITTKKDAMYNNLHPEWLAGFSSLRERII